MESDDATSLYNNSSAPYRRVMNHLNLLSERLQHVKYNVTNVHVNIDECQPKAKPNPTSVLQKLLQKIAVLPQIEKEITSDESLYRDLCESLDENFVAKVLGQKESWDRPFRPKKTPDRCVNANNSSLILSPTPNMAYLDRVNWQGREASNSMDDEEDTWSDDNDIGYYRQPLSVEDFYRMEEEAAQRQRHDDLIACANNEDYVEDEGDKDNDSNSCNKAEDLAFNDISNELLYLQNHQKNKSNAVSIPYRSVVDVKSIPCSPSSQSAFNVGSSSSLDVGVDAAVWPRQPNQFAFSQEDDGTVRETDEAYSEATVDNGEELDDHYSPDSYLESLYLDDIGYEYNEEVMDKQSVDSNYDVFDLKIICEKNKTGFEEKKDFKAKEGDIVANRYKVCSFIGEAAFSTTYQCIEISNEERPVCIKVIKNSKDFFDQSLDEIKILKYMNSAGCADKHYFLKLYDYFYYKEHVFIVTELLQHNLYEVFRIRQEQSEESYYTIPRLKRIMKQCLLALHFTHSLNLIHCDLKPENILIRSYESCDIKVIDFGSSCFTTDHLSTYVQSRSYRAPEVILGLPYDQKIDLWSLGCILVELYTGQVIFSNDSIQTLLARVIALLGPFPEYMLRNGRQVSQYFTSNDILYEHSLEHEGFTLIYPKKTSLWHRLKTNDTDFIDFVSHLLQLDPAQRFSAAAALKHPWLHS